MKHESYHHYGRQVILYARQADWKALRGAVVGCLALLRRKANVGTATESEARAVAESFLQNLQVQSLGQHDKLVCLDTIYVSSRVT